MNSNISPLLTPLDTSLVASKLDAKSPSKEVNKVASEFESIFLSLMLKEMRNTLDSEEGGLFGKEGSDTFGGMFDMFMGQHLAESQPLGVGDAIKGYLQNSAEREHMPSKLSER
ncbi:MAG: rod-binding protein [Mariniblastus sp.]